MKKSPASLTLVDTNSAFLITEWVRTQTGSTPAERPPTFSYGDLLTVLAEFRRGAAMRPVDVSLAFVSLDPANRSQQKFPDALERFGYVVERLDFRHNFISAVSPTEGEKHERQGVASLGPNIAYTLGLMAGQAGGSTVKPEVVLVSGGFEAYNPLLHFVRRTGGKAALCFFRRFIDPRWLANGILDPDSPIQFWDLEPHSEQLLGVSLGKLLKGGGAPGRSGLDSIF